MIKTDEAKLIAKKIRLALLKGMKPGGKTAVFSFAILALDNRLKEAEDVLAIADNERVIAVCCKTTDQYEDLWKALDAFNGVKMGAKGNGDAGGS